MLKYVQYFVYSLFMHELFIYEIKMVRHSAFFHNLIWKYSAFDQFSKQLKKNNTSPKYRAKTIVIFNLIKTRSTLTMSAGRSDTDP